MSASGFAGALGSALLATGCMSHSIDASTHLPEPATIPVEGTYRHPPSGLEFPERLGRFRRTEVVRYDEEGRDVSAGYVPPPGSFPIFVTVYVYPGREVSSFLVYGRTLSEYTDRLAKQDFKAERDAVLDHYDKDQKAAMVSEEGVTLSLGGAERRGWRAEFSVEGALGVPGMPCTSLLYWFPSVEGKWNVKYRVTHPTLVNPGDSVEALLREVPWTPGPR